MYLKKISGVLIAAVLAWSSLQSVYAQEEHRVFLSDKDTDFAIYQILQTALHDCPNEDEQLTQQENLKKRQHCLVESVVQQATPDSLRRMVTIDLHHKITMLGQECESATLSDRRSVVCQIHRLLIEEHKKRLWAFGPIAEGNPPQWRK